jgi:hypothetical protein
VINHLRLRLSEVQPRILLNRVAFQAKPDGGHASVLRQRQPHGRALTSRLAAYSLTGRSEAEDDGGDDGCVLIRRLDEVPVDEVPVDEVPLDEVPVDEVPVDEVPDGDALPRHRI